MTYQTQTQMRLLDDVRKEAPSAQDMVWRLEGNDMSLEIERPGYTDRYVWNLTDGRYVHPVTEAELKSA
ncbi:MAG: hypothetical protein M3317_15230 [Actinomycetota bacterium]|nr:hypothetical protein [Actinomycetota bacterium]